MYENLRLNASWVLNGRVAYCVQGPYSLIAQAEYCDSSGASEWMLRLSPSKSRSSRNANGSRSPANSTAQARGFGATHRPTSLWTGILSSGHLLELGSMGRSESQQCPGPELTC